MKQRHQTAPSSASPSPKYVVGVGASAGGLAALTAFFRELPATVDAAFVVVQHLSPDFKSHMSALLGRVTDLGVEQASNETPIRPRTIYLIPPAKVMIIAGGRLLLTDRAESESLSLPIDDFFRSLAIERKRSAVGIVLSGTGSDGSRGLLDIHAEGGLAMAQAPDTAEFAGMPNAAVETGTVDVIDAPSGLAHCLARYLEDSLDRETLMAQQAMTLPEPVLLQLFEALKSKCGVDFSEYKKSTVDRRIERRRALKSGATIEQYAQELLGDDQELHALHEDLFIGVTRFRRDEEAFLALSSEALPRLFEDESSAEPIRVWAPGCSTGHEAFSIAICIAEHQRERGLERPVRIFATDADSRALAIASRGAFTEEELACFSEEIREQYFARDEDEYQIKHCIREQIVFTQHNLLADPPLTQMDLLSCRNLLIYFQASAQKRTLSLFHFALKPSGVLFLGPSENVGDLEAEFSTLDARWRIFQKRRDIRARARASQLSPSSMSKLTSLGGRVRARPENSDRRRVLEAILEQKLAPSALVSASDEVIHMFGGVEEFLQLQSGELSTNLLDLINSELRASLAAAIRHARRDLAPVRYAGAAVSGSEGPRVVDILVEPVSSVATQKGALLVSFEPTKTGSDLAGEVRTPLVVDANEITQLHISELESELTEARENLQATVEELETANEELQASNEELVASNEELHSTNEELFSVNREHEERISQLSKARADMDNLLAVTEVGVIFVDAELHIRRFTPKIAALFQLEDRDVGRPLTAFSHGLAGIDIESIAKEVMATQAPHEGEVVDRDGTPYLLRIASYTRDSSIRGVVLALIEISSLVEAQREVERFQHMVDQSEDMFTVLDANGCFTYANQAFCDEVGRERGELVGRGVPEIDPGWTIPMVRELFREVHETGGKVFETVNRSSQGLETRVEVSVSAIRAGGEKLMMARSKNISLRSRQRAYGAFANLVDSLVFSETSEHEVIGNVTRALVEELGVELAEAWTLEGENFGEIRLHAHGTSDAESPSPAPPSISNAKRAFLQAVASGKPHEAVISDAEHLYADAQSQSWPEKVCAFAVTPSPGKRAVFLARYRGEDAVFQEGMDTTCAGTARSLDALFERRSAESALQLRERAIAASNDGIVIGEAHGGEFRFVYVNSGFERITGYQEAGALGANWSLLRGPDAPNAESQQIEQAIQDRTPLRVALPLVRPGGETYWGDLQITPVAAETGEAVHFVGVLHDISDRMDDERALLEANQKALSASRAKTRFLANVSHDIRSPLTAIIGFTDALEHRLGNQGSSKELEAIRRNADYLLSLIRDILEISKIEAGKMPVATEQFDLPNLLSDTWALMGVKATEKGVPLSFRLSAPLPRFVQTDATRLRQVIVNLVGNAIKFTPEGRVEVTVEVGTHLGTPHLVIRVSDSGIGIAAEDLNEIFKPFSRPHVRRDADAADFEGTGLGLSIVQGLVRALQGSIEVTSEIGKGTTFDVQLPIVVPEDNEMVTSISHAPKVRSAPANARRASLKGMRVLVADDGEDVAEVIAFYLHGAGADVDTVANGKEAVEAVEARGLDGFDVVVLDMQMPVMDGYEAARTLRAAGFSRPIVALTAGAMQGDQQRCIEAGCSAFLLKPAEQTELISTILDAAKATTDSEPLDGEEDNG